MNLYHPLHERAGGLSIRRRLHLLALYALLWSCSGLEHRDPIPEPVIVPPSVRLQDPDPAVRRQALVDIANSGDTSRENFALITSGMSDPDRSVANTAFFCLEHLSHVAAHQGLFHNNPTDDGVFVQIMQTVAESHLKGSDPKRKNMALFGIRQLPGQVLARHVALFVDMISDPLVDDEVLLGILFRLGPVATEEMSQRIQPGRKEWQTQRYVIFFTQAIIGSRDYDETYESGIPKALSPQKRSLIRAVDIITQSAPDSLALQVVELLAELGPDGKPYVAYLRKIKKKGDPSIKGAATEAILHITPDPAISTEVAHELISVTNDAERVRLAEMLSHPEAREKAKLLLAEHMRNDTAKRRASAFLGLLVLARAVASRELDFASTDGTMASRNADDQRFYEECLRIPGTILPDAAMVAALIESLDSVDVYGSYMRRNVFAWMLAYHGPPIPGLLPLILNKNLEYVPDPSALPLAHPDDVPSLVQLTKEHESHRWKQKGKEESISAGEEAMRQLALFPERARPFLPVLAENAFIGCSYGWPDARDTFRKIGLDAPFVKTLIEWGSREPSEDFGGRCKAAILLGALDPNTNAETKAGVEQVLLKIAADEHWETASEAMTSLAQIDSAKYCHQAVDFYQRRLDAWTDIPYQSRIAAEGLGRLGSCADHALPSLRKAAKHEQPYVRAAALEAIKRITDQKR